MKPTAVRSSEHGHRLVNLADVQAPSSEPVPELTPVPVGQPSALTWPNPIGSGLSHGGKVARAAVAAPQVQLQFKVHGPLPRLPRGEIQTQPVSFAGVGHEYAWMWFQHVLAMVLTLGLYGPWAHVRTQRYFLRRTVVAGAALDYHATPTGLLPRYVLILGLVAGVLGAWSGSRLAGMLALSMAMAVVPLLVWVSLTHRAAHTSWAQRRLRFDGACQGVYRALSGALAAACLVAWALMAVVAWHRPAGWFAWGVIAALWGMAAPAFVWSYLQFRQHHVVLGPVRLFWRGQRDDVIMLFIKTLAWAATVLSLLAGIGAMVLAAVLAARGRVSTLSLSLGLAGVGAAVLLAVVPYAQARMQSLVWSQTGNRYLRFHSQLPVGLYVRAFLRQAVVVVLTAGLYWPWAVVALRKLRTESLLVHTRIDADVLRANWTPRKRARRTKMAG